MLQRWFDSFRNTPSSTVVNGLELLAALAIASCDGKLVDKLGTVFDVFDFDDSRMITLDELCILLKSVVRGLSKITVGLGPRLASLSAMREVGALARQCFAACDLEEEEDLPRDAFVQWVRQTPKLVNLLRCFVRREFLTREDAAVTIQRCTRGMLSRREAAERRLELQLELHQELHDAAQKIQDAVVSRKKKRDTMRQIKIEKFAHHGALYSFGSNARAQLGHASLELSQQLSAPLLASYFKNNELRVTHAALSSAHACAVTSDGQIFTWGAGVPGSFGFLSRALSKDKHSDADDHVVLSQIRKAPARVEDLDDVVIASCALGSHHSVALSQSGVLYTWGSGAFGQLGHGDIRSEGHEIFKRQFDQHTGREYPIVELPLQLDRSFFEEMRVLQVACGYYFTVAVCEDGSVFTWGEGSDGQLGVGYSDHFSVGFLDEHIHGSSFVYMHSPTRVDELKEPIASVAVGGNHVFAVARDQRHVFEWGAWHRRGGDAQDSAFSPQRNDFLSTLAVSSIASGKEHTLAVGARVEIALFIERPYQREAVESTRAVVKGAGLCALFGAPPVALLTRALTGPLFVYGQSSGSAGYSVTAASGSSASASTAAASRAMDRTSGSMAAMLTSTVYDRKESQIRSSLSSCTGKIVYVDRSTSTGHWVVVPMIDDQSSSKSVTLLEIPCAPAAFGPEVTEAGIAAKVWYSPEKLESLRLYVRPDEVVGRVVVLEFDQDDISFESDDLELSEMISLIMISLVEKVKDAQESGAAAVVIVFDFLDADAFPLQAADDEDFEFKVPVVMVKKAGQGELLLHEVSRASKPFAMVCYREDILSKQVSAIV
ncbi:hypothetical protein PINS_up014525 [Pythium insidiosum]|nr:hypothetical protein PINS_up014525 [Pythium insidiosum]